MKGKSWLLLAGVIVCSIIPGVIYKTDTRLDCFQSPSWAQNYTKNVVVAIVESQILGPPNKNGVYHRLESYYSLARSQYVCINEKFSSQPAPISCSGTLIGVDRVLTAGHCVTSYTCSSMKFVFDFFMTSNTTFEQISEDDVYSCRRVYSLNKYKRFDYAIVQLDRPARGRQPQTIIPDPSEFPLEKSSELFMIGFSAGTPAKYVTGNIENPMSVAPYYYFTATIDSFTGNSGSGVLDSNHRLIGTLVSGLLDYDFDIFNLCYRPRVIQCNNLNCSDHTGPSESISFSFPAIVAVPSCLNDTDCIGSVSGSFCDRSCSGSAICCTGWCSSQHYEPNYNISDCPAYFNYTLKDVDDSDDTGGPNRPEEDQNSTTSVFIGMITLFFICSMCFLRYKTKQRQQVQPFTEIQQEQETQQERAPFVRRR